MPQPLDLFAFYSNPSQLEELIECDIDAVVIDWETKGKDKRQNLYNTQVNKHTISDLETVQKAGAKNIICRVNGQRFLSEDEIKTAIDRGAKEILIPMIKTLQEVDLVFNWINNQCSVALMVETNEAISLIDRLDQYNVSRFYLGLNDLSIQRKSHNLFNPLVDGTVENLRPKINSPGN